MGLPSHPLERFRCLKCQATRAPKCATPGAHLACGSGDSAAFRLQLLVMRRGEDRGWVNPDDEPFDGDLQLQVWAIKDDEVLEIRGGPKGCDADDLVEEPEDILLSFNARDTNDLDVPT